MKYSKMLFLTCLISIFSIVANAAEQKYSCVVNGPVMADCSSCIEVVKNVCANITPLKDRTPRETCAEIVKPKCKNCENDSLPYCDVNALPLLCEKS